jgi:hypothetical protein
MTAVSDFLIASVYIAAVARRWLISAWHATKPERTAHEHHDPYGP